MQSCAASLFPRRLREEAFPLQSAPVLNARVLGCAAGSSVA